MATTYDPIASTTLTSSASSVTFSSLDTIAAGYRDLIVVADFTTSSSTNYWTRLNGDTGSNYSVVEMGGNSGGTVSSASTFDRIYTAPSTVTGASLKNQTMIQLMDFSATDKHKSLLYRADSAATSTTFAMAARWANTSAVTSIVLGLNAGNFETGSVFSLFGIVA